MSQRDAASAAYALELTREEVGLAIDALAMLVKVNDPSEYRPLLHKLQDFYRATKAAS